MDPCRGTGLVGLTAGLDLPDGSPLGVGDAVTVRGPAPVGVKVDGPVLALVCPESRDRRPLFSPSNALGSRTTPSPT